VFNCFYFQFSLSHLILLLFDNQNDFDLLLCNLCLINLEDFSSSSTENSEDSFLIEGLLYTSDLEGSISKLKT